MITNQSLENFTKFMFFTGKGGVGKTSLACATAVKLADEGYKVLLISTDPASNLEDVLQTKVSDKIQPHIDLFNLKTINIDPEQSAEEYRQRVLVPYKSLATAEEYNKIKEGLSGACTTEIASFDEFSRFITGEDNPDDFDFIIFDTAPTGHTLRLLELPAAWDTFLENNPEGASCIGPSSALKSSKERYKKVISTLRDVKSTTYYIVSRTDEYSLKEAAKTSHELVELSMTNQKLLINGIFKAIDKNDTFAVKIEKNAAQKLSNIPDQIKNLTAGSFPLLPYNILGLQKLRSIYNQELQKKISEDEISTVSVTKKDQQDLLDLVDSLEKNKKSGLIMTMGKGGVGKTIVAASIATMLAQRGHEVLLTTTDPAAHVNNFMNQLGKIPDNLTIERIDPKVETQNYIDKILEQKGANLNDEGKRLLLEDLKSPCTEEVAVFHAFSKAIYRAKRQFVVMDTAPTGHTLLLLDTTGSYHKEIMKKTTPSSVKISTPYMALQDTEFAKILLVALPETTPMREAELLQNDLKRAGIIPYAWVINQCLSQINNLSDPLLKKRAIAESNVINRIEEVLSKRTYLIPFIPEEKLLPSILELYNEK